MLQKVFFKGNLLPFHAIIFFPKHLIFYVSSGALFCCQKFAPNLAKNGYAAAVPTFA